MWYDQAFSTTVQLMGKYDHVVLFHSFSDANMAVLPPAYCPDAIRHKYEGKLIEEGVRDGDYTFHFEDQGPFTPLHALHDYLCRYQHSWSQPTDSLEALSVYAMDFSTMFPPDFIVLGGTGVRGRDEVNSTLGSTVDKALRTVHIPCIICKRSCSSSTRTFIMAVDATEHSRLGLDILLKMVRKCDTLRLLHMVPAAPSSPRPPVSQSDGIDDTASTTTVIPEARPKFQVDVSKESPIVGHHTSGSHHSQVHNKVSADDSDSTLPANMVNTVRKYYQSELAKRGPHLALFEVNEVFLGEGDSIAGALVDYVNAENPDFFALAPRAQANMTSITEYVIANVQTSIVLCRN
jgi:hypothetical protein